MVDPASNAGAGPGAAVATDRHYLSLLEAFGRPIALVDDAGRITCTNSAMATILGCDVDSLRGELLAGFLEAGGGDAPAWDAVADTGTGLQRRVRRPDGSTVEVELRVTPVAGPVARSLVECIDASERVTRDVELAAALAEVSTLLSATPAPIVVFDDRRRIMGINHAAEELFGWREAELIDEDVALLVVPGQGAGARAIAAQGEELGGWSRARRSTLQVRRRDGSAFPAEVAIREVPGRAAGRRRFVATLEDLSGKAQTEAQLLEAQRSEALGRLVAGVAHDFNNLLSVIGGSIELAQGRDPEADRWLERAETAAGRAASIIRQLLQYARREPSELAPVDLAALAEATTNLLRGTIDRRISIELKAATGLPRVMANESQVEQVLMNLLVNACDAVLERLDAQGRDAIGGGRVTISLERPTGDGGRAIVTLGVRDNGNGIPPDILDRVLDPFFTTKPEGTGLGLSTSFGIVRAHGGTLEVFSEPGVGTLFEVSLPAAEPGGAAALRSEDEDRDTLPLPRAVLVVDDEQDVLAITSRMLEDAGCTVATAPDGFAAVDAARARDFDLVLLDVNMPGPGGWTVLDWLLASRLDQTVLMMSGFGSEAEARVRGAVGLLSKPFDSTALLGALRRAMAAHGRGEGRSK